MRSSHSVVLCIFSVFHLSHTSFRPYGYRAPSLQTASVSKHVIRVVPLVGVGRGIRSPPFLRDIQSIMWRFASVLKLGRVKFLSIQAQGLFRSLCHSQLLGPALKLPHPRCTLALERVISPKGSLSIKKSKKKTNKHMRHLLLSLMYNSEW